MAISTEIVGLEFGPFIYEYDFRDLEICALGCGAGFDGRTDLEYVNEHDAKSPSLKVLPILGALLSVNEEITRTLDYGYDYSGSLHFGFDLRLHAPFRMEDRVRTFVTQAALYDRGEGRGCLSKQVGESYSSDGTHLCTMESWDICINDGGWGGEQPPRDLVEMPAGAPDAVVEETYQLNGALIYRLMGDWHQQHIDWSYTEQTGLARPTAQGLSFAGMAMRHVIAAFMPGDPERLTRFKTRMTSPVLPGMTLRTEMWQVGEKEIRFRLVDAHDPEAKPFMNWGIAEWK